MGRKKLNLYNNITKTCKDCGKTYPRTTEFFYKDLTNTDGVKHLCKECEKARVRKNNERNRGVRNKQEFMTVEEIIAEQEALDAYLETLPKKKCRRCGEEFPAYAGKKIGFHKVEGGFFYTDRSKKDGLSIYCRACQNKIAIESNKRRSFKDIYGQLGLEWQPPKNSKMIDMEHELMELRKYMSDEEFERVAKELYE